jgi:hypothetical protein
MTGNIGKLKGELQKAGKKIEKILEPAKSSEKQKGC